MEVATDENWAKNFQNVKLENYLVQNYYIDHHCTYNLQSRPFFRFSYYFFISYTRKTFSRFMKILNFRKKLFLNILFSLFFAQMTTCRSHNVAMY